MENNHTLDSSVDLEMNRVDENGDNFDVRRLSRRMKDNELFAAKKRKNKIYYGTKFRW